MAGTCARVHACNHAATHHAARQEHTRSSCAPHLAQLGQRQLDAPDLALAAQAILAHELELLVQALLLEGAAGRLEGRAVCRPGIREAPSAWQSAAARAAARRGVPRQAAGSSTVHSQLRSWPIFTIARVHGEATRQCGSRRARHTQAKNLFGGGCAAILNADWAEGPATNHREPRLLSLFSFEFRAGAGAGTASARGKQRVFARPASAHAAPVSRAPLCSGFGTCRTALQHHSAQPRVPQSRVRVGATSPPRPCPWTSFSTTWSRSNRMSMLSGAHDAHPRRRAGGRG